jgi:hypothetical protein
MTTEREQKIAARVAQFPSGMAESEVAAALNAPDPALLTWAVVPFKDIATVFRNTLAPVEAKVNPTDPKTAMIALLDAASTPSHVSHNVARQAVELFNRNDAPQLDATDEAERITATTLFAILASPDAGILRPEAEATILSSLQRPQSWADLEGVGEVTSRDVGIARGNN